MEWYKRPIDPAGGRLNIRLVSVCRLHGCTLCCHVTEMPLSGEDIVRITGLGFRVGSFVKERGEMRRLRNRRGRCVFLGNGCTIYPDRPEGCRLYPVVYDPESGQAVLDEVCPFRKEFRKSFKKTKRLARLYATLSSERGEVLKASGDRE